VLLTACLLISVFYDRRNFFRTDVRLVEVKNSVNHETVVDGQV